MWDKMHEVYVRDKFNTGIQNFFRKENPFALQEVTAVMLETARKGYWSPDENVLNEIADMHAKLVVEFDAGCSGFVCDNAKLKQFISNKVAPELKKNYQAQISSVRQVSGAAQQKNIKLQKVQDKKFQDIIRDNQTLTFIIIGLFLFLVVAVIYGRIRR
jgi:cobaltochelatase CobN